MADVISLGGIRNKRLLDSLQFSDILGPDVYLFTRKEDLVLDLLKVMPNDISDIYFRFNSEKLTDEFAFDERFVSKFYRIKGGDKSYFHNSLVSRERFDNLDCVVNKSRMPLSWTGKFLEDYIDDLMLMKIRYDENSRGDILSSFYLGTPNCGFKLFLGRDDSEVREQILSKGYSYCAMRAELNAVKFGLPILHNMIEKSFMSDCTFLFHDNLVDRGVFKTPYEVLEYDCSSIFNVYDEIV